MMEPDSDKTSTFEASLRFLGNELVGVKIVVDDFKTKWIVLSLVAVLGMTGIVATYGGDLKELVTGEPAVQEVSE